LCVYLKQVRGAVFGGGEQQLVRSGGVCVSARARACVCVCVP
jgi:hypothetical protein